MPTSSSKPQEVGPYSPIIRELYHTGKYSDLTLECDNLRFKVHKAILCIRSPVFARECDGSFKEGKTGHISIEAPTANKNSVRRMLDFIYTNNYQDDDSDTSPNGVTIFSADEQVAAVNDTDELLAHELVTNTSKLSLKEGTQATQVSIFGDVASEGSMSERVTPKVSEAWHKKTPKEPKLSSNTGDRYKISPPSKSPFHNSLFVVNDTQLHQQTLNNLDVYALAQYYQIDDLKRIATIKFDRRLSLMSYVATTAFSDIVHNVFELTDTASLLRSLVISRALYVLDRGPDTRWLSQVADIPEFMEGVLRQKVAADARRFGSPGSLGMPGSQQNTQRARQLEKQQVQYEILDSVMRHGRCSTGKECLYLDFANFPLFVSALGDVSRRPTVTCKGCDRVLFEGVVGVQART